LGVESVSSSSSAGEAGRGVVLGEVKSLGEVETTSLGSDSSELTSERAGDDGMTVASSSSFATESLLGREDPAEVEERASASALEEEERMVHLSSSRGVDTVESTTGGDVSLIEVEVSEKEEK
jgi:hypothetical protein